MDPDVKLFVAILCSMWIASAVVTFFYMIASIASGNLNSRSSMHNILKLTPRAWWETTVFNPFGGVLIWIEYVFINPLALILLAISYLMKD